MILKHTEIKYQNRIGVGLDVEIKALWVTLDLLLLLLLHFLASLDLYLTKIERPRMNCLGRNKKFSNIKIRKNNYKVYLKYQN